MKIRPAGRLGRAALAAVVVAGALVVPLASQASADPAPPAPVETVGADALPTWQINGVVWSQAIVGNTVYVTGSFTAARPPGVAVGGPGEVAAQNIFAYDIRTGERVAAFSHSLNAQGLVIRGSADGSRVYVGGDFTDVDGTPRGHVAAFDTATGALSGWAPNIGGQVRGLAMTASTVYVGGNYPSANGQPRAHLAAFQVSNAAMTAWAPQVAGTGGYVWTMVMTPDQSQVVVGGSFDTLNTVPAYGMGAVDATSGATKPWAAQERIRTAGLNGGITSLKADDTSIYGSGYAFGAGATFEGNFAADPDGGAIRWVNDCLGDQYDVEPFAGALYSVGHVHNCSNIDGFPDTNPRSRWQKAMASPLAPVGVIANTDAYGWDFRGLPYTGVLQWYPDLEFGSYTADRQAAWAVEASGNYVVLGGEFPMVNGAAQQGLTRFLKKSVGPHSMKPLYITAMNPVATSTESGTVRVRFGSTWDRDDETLTYDIYRDGGPSIATLTSKGVWWKLPPLLFTDTGRTPGATHTYKVRAKDATGNVQWSLASGSVVVSSEAPSPYATQARSDGAQHLWRLESGAQQAIDTIGAADLTLVDTTSAAGIAGAALGSPGGATAKGYTTFAEPKPDAVTLEAWVKTTSIKGGRILGLGSSAGNSSISFDLALYLGNNGRVNLGVRDSGNSMVTTTSSQAVNDGQWHHVVGLVDAGGSSIVIDGRRSGRNQNGTGGPALDGYWRVLGDSMSVLLNRPTDSALAGTIDEVAVYPTALPIEKVRAHYTALTGADPAAATPTDSYGGRVAADAPDWYWRLGEPSGSVAKDSSASASDGTLTGVSGYGRAGAVAGTTNTSMTFNGTSGALAAPQAWGAPKAYSTEAWFQTTTTRGGRIIGFGNGTTSLSTNYDRLVCMQNDGRLLFGVGNGNGNQVLTPSSYNDGKWHHMVATQGADGMRLYVDGVQRGAGSATTAGSYTGYWRAAGDRCYSGATSSYFAGALDEVAVYPRVLPASAVGQHFVAGGGVMANQPPTARFTKTATYLSVAFDGTGSTDPDGQVASYAWTFGDGTTSTLSAPTHVYGQAGTFPVTLTVKDADGASSVSSGTVTVVANKAPTAAFTTAVSGLSVTTNAAASADTDGTIASYAWNFGDGSTGTGATASHPYATDGTYLVRLTVTDDQGATGTTTQNVTVARAANIPPTASFSSSVSFLDVALDASASSDPDGTIATWAWSFGDGATGTGRTTSHSYGTAGSYDVVLTVTDDRGGSTQLTKTVTVAANQAPVARFATSVDRLVVGFDGSTSTDAEGAVASYAWVFGDGATGSGRTASHTYATDGSYTVKLTVTDGQGASDTATATVTLVGDPSVARDAFDRVLTGGWGTADRGGAWTPSGTLSRYSVSGGVGSVTLGVGGTAKPMLNAVSITETELSTVFSTDKAPTGGGQYVSLVSRAVSGGSEYRAKVLLASTGAVTAYITRVDAGSETSLGSAVVPGLSYAAGTKLQMRFQATGTSPTNLRMKVWAQAQNEPAAWVLSRTDSTAGLQTAGSVGLYHYVSGSATNAPVVFTDDDVWVGPPRP